MKWELDLWYELWDRAGSQGLDTGMTCGVRGVIAPTPDTRLMPAPTSSKKGERGLDRTPVQSGRNGPDTR